MNACEGVAVAYCSKLQFIKEQERERRGGSGGGQHERIEENVDDVWLQ